MSRFSLSGYVALAAFASLSSLPARAEPCRTIDQGLKILEEAGAMNPRFLEGELKARAVAFLNDLPQPAPEQWTIVMAVDMPNGGGILTGGIDGAFCLEARVEPRDWEVVLAKIEGARI